MAGKESKILYRRLLRSYFSSVISISLVLFLVGMTGALIVNAKSVSNYFKENITVSAVLNVEADEADASALADSLERTSYIKNVRIITKAEGVEEMKEILGDDFMDVFEVNPIPVSLELQIAADYISADSLSIIEEALYGYPAVDDVVYQQSLVELLNANIERIGDQQYCEAQCGTQAVYDQGHAPGWRHQGIYNETFCRTGFFPGTNSRGCRGYIHSHGPVLCP